MKKTTTIPKFKLKDERLWHFRVFVTRVIDGDTAEVICDLGFGNMRIERIRFLGIDTPELRPRKGTDEEKAAEKVAAIAAKQRVIELIEGREVIIRSAKAGKFGRWLADIYLPDDIISELGRVATGDEPPTVNQLLLDEGHAVPYPK